MSTMKTVKTTKEPKSLYVWTRSYEWGITTDLREALEKRGGVRAATKEDMENLVLAGTINPKVDKLDLVLLNDGIYIWVEGGFINEFGDEDYYCEYVKIRNGNLYEDKLTVDGFIEICGQIKGNGMLDTKTTNTLKYCNFNEKQEKIVLDFARYLVNDDMLSLEHGNWFKN